MGENSGEKFLDGGDFSILVLSECNHNTEVQKMAV